LGKIAFGDFSGLKLRFRRQKTWFLPPELARSYARAGAFFGLELRSRRLRAPGKKRGLIY
jgi:hypothetical protein